MTSMAFGAAVSAAIACHCCEEIAGPQGIAVNAIRCASRFDLTYADAWLWEFLRLSPKSGWWSVVCRSHLVLKDSG